ncbi:NAD-dependent epimerase/dehydratase family protein [Aestuariivivens sediminicola]|uniref:NAD-dependent epimerase/dehydratase family protein n=1 Tax=Aestuariivivens sediminicola TaxID=2913560 RepID=UPI001F5A6BC6|nr:NAD-dependent epimerase/dehydratase family protein [Aestuariivivens sediminicola]
MYYTILGIMGVENILITGASGQLGAVLTKSLQQKFGIDHVIATDLRPNKEARGIFEKLDATDPEALKQVVKRYKVTQIYHMVAILSAKGEAFPQKTWDINMGTLLNVLEISRLLKVKKVFYPSSIAVFGHHISRVDTPQFSNLTPTTVYGMTKVAGENWGNYYFNTYQLDVRSIRYPGVIGYQSLPGGGTTDYAVDIYHKAVKQEPFECFLKASTRLPMMYIEDAVRASIELMDAPAEKLSVRTSYNIAGMSFSPEDIAASIRKTYPNFEVRYNPDFRQKIADSWPMSIDDSKAREDWGWKPRFDLDAMSRVMIENLKSYYNSVIA